MSTIEMVVEDLKMLPPHILEQAAGYIHSLKSVQGVNRETLLSRTAGALSTEEADEWEKAISEDCEKIDARDWK